MYYSESHEWVHKETENEVSIGITDYAQRELGEIVYCQLPEVGKEIHAGDEIVILESTKAAADIYSPVSGKIIAVNEAASENPELINRSSQKEGWLIKVSLSDPSELDNLMSQEQYLMMIS